MSDYSIDSATQVQMNGPSGTLVNGVQANFVAAGGRITGQATVIRSPGWDARLREIIAGRVAAGLELLADENVREVHYSQALGAGGNMETVVLVEYASDDGAISGDVEVPLAGEDWPAEVRAAYEAELAEMQGLLG